MEKIRLDALLFEKGLAASREKARAMIMAGEVQINGKIIDKPGCKVQPETEVIITPVRQPYVSRGGLKIEGAIRDFKLDFSGRSVLDIGASTGGYTDCALQHGAVKVFALDVGYGQLDYRLREDERVVPLERTNARYVDRLPEPVSLIVADASFISLRLLLPVFKGWIADAADVIVLIKPQFEAGKGQVGKGGVVRDPAIHAQVLDDVLASAEREGYSLRGLIASPLKGPAGNIEFLAWLALPPAEPVDRAALIAEAVESGHSSDPQPSV